MNIWEGIHAKELYKLDQKGAKEKSTCSVLKAIAIGKEF